MWSKISSSVPSTAPATGLDGLPDDIAFALGADPHKADNFVPGISDLTALQEGLIGAPLLASTTGVVASLALPGQAEAVVLQGSLTQNGQQYAYVVGTFGLAIVDATRFQKPILLGQIQLPVPTATSVAVDATLGLAAVATGGGGLQIVNVADPKNPKLIQTIDRNATQVQIISGIAYANDGSTLDAFDLAAGTQLQTVVLGSATITSLAHDGAMLYAMDSNNSLWVIDTGSGHTVLKGSVSLPSGGGGIFAANGVVYVGTGTNDRSNGGYLTVDVSNPSTPKLLEGVDAANIAGTAIALNGSGLGVSVQNIITNNNDVNVLDVVNTSDPTKTGQFITRYTLPGQPNDVAIGQGIAFVADGAAGLQVVNYLPFDTNGVAPTITITQLPADLDPSAPGIQAREGRTVTLGATISDDVQVRNVEVLVNGVVVSNSVSYPWNLSARLPTIAANGSDQVTLQVEAIDTGGNVATSAPVQAQLAPDSGPLQLTGQSVLDGAIASQNLRAFLFQFSKPLDESIVTAANFTLVGPGGQPVAPQSIQFRDDDTVVQLTYPQLAFGQYQLDIAAAGVKDRAGDTLGSTVLATNFTVMPFTATWTNAKGGNWNDPANWSSGHIPGLSDSVLIDLPLGASVISGAAARAATISIEGGGTLNVTGTLLVPGQIDAENGVLQLGSLGAVQSATITSSGGSVVLAGGTLDAVTYQGVLDLSAPTGASVVIRDGITLTGRGGVGPGLIELTGGSSLLHLVGPTTLDNATISIGSSASAPNTIFADDGQGGPTTLTLGSHLTINHVGTSAGGAVALTAASGGTIVSAATINADFFGRNFVGNSFVGGSITVNGLDFVNQGTVAISNTDSFNIDTTEFTNSATGTLSATTGGTLSINASSWSNAGAISESGGIVNLGGTFTMALLGNFTRSGGTVNITGTLDNTGQTLNVGNGTALGTLTLTGGTIKNGTIHDAELGILAPAPVPIQYLSFGGGEIASGSALDGVTYEGNFDLSTGASLIIKNGITLTGLDGTGSGSATIGHFGILYFQGSQTLDNATISLNGRLYDYEVDGLADTLTLGSNLVINDAPGDGPDITGGAFIQEYYDNHGKIINAGTINASAGVGAGVTIGGFRSALFDFTNQGRLSVSNGDTLTIDTASFTNAAGAALSITTGGIASIDAHIWSNAGSISENSGTLNLGGAFTLADLGTLTRTGGTVNLTGTLDDTGTILNVGTGSALGTLILTRGDAPLAISGGPQLAAAGADLGPVVSIGTIVNGTIGDVGGGLVFDLGILDGVTYQGTIDLSSASAELVITDGITLTGSTGSGRGLIDLTGSNGSLYVDGSETLDNATINIGTNNGTDVLHNVNNIEFIYVNSLTARNDGSSAVLTLGSGLTVNHVGRNAELSGGAPAFDGTGIVNEGTINATLPGGIFTIDPSKFTNQGTINVANGDAVVINTNFTNFSAGTLTGGVYVVSGTSTLTLPKDEIITTLAADVTLSGAGPALRSQQSGTFLYSGLDTTLATITSAGAFRLLGGFSANEAQAVSDSGVLQLEGGTFATPALTVAPGGSVIGFGIVAAPVVNDGSVEAQTDLLEITGDLAGTGTDSIDADTTLQLDGAVTGGQTVTFAGSDGILAVEEPSVFAATISGFAAADLIDLFGITATAVSYQANVLTVLNGATTVASLNLAGNYAGNTDFEVSSDGVGGTRISIGPPPALVGNFWTSASGGDWGTAANWNPATVPDRVATISLPGTYTVTIASNETFNIGTLIVSDTGATLSVAGTLDLTDTLFLKRGTVSIAFTGTIAGGTIDVTGGTLSGIGDGSGGLFSPADGVGGTLDGVTLEGTLDLSATNAAVSIKDGITLAGKDGNGLAAINLTGSNSNFYVQGPATLSNATINIGASSEAKLYNDDRAGPSVLTLGPSLTVNQVANNAMFGSTFFRSGSGIVNAGTINAGVNGGNFTILSRSFTNQGQLTVSNGDTVVIDPEDPFMNSAIGTLSASGGGTLWIQTSSWTNSGSISMNAATLNLGGTFTLAQLGSITRSGGTINIFGTLDNTGTTLDVGTGTALGTLTLDNGSNRAGTIEGGTIADSGSGLLFVTGSGISPFSPVQYSGLLDGVTYQGTLDLTPDGSYVAIKDGITLEGAGGIGKAVINLGSSLRGSSKKNEIDALGNQTLDNVVINVGSGFTSSIIRTDDSVLTLGPNLTVNAAEAGEGVEFTDLPSHTNAARGGSIVDAGTINASLTNTIGVVLFDSASFTNQGIITVSNNATVAIRPRFSWRIPERSTSPAARWR